MGLAQTMELIAGAAGRAADNLERAGRALAGVRSDAERIATLPKNAPTSPADGSEAGSRPSSLAGAGPSSPAGARPSSPAGARPSSGSATITTSDSIDDGAVTRSGSSGGGTGGSPQTTVTRSPAEPRLDERFAGGRPRKPVGDFSAEKKASERQSVFGGSTAGIEKRLDRQTAALESIDKRLAGDGGAGVRALGGI